MSDSKNPIDAAFFDHMMSLPEDDFVVKNAGMLSGIRIWRAAWETALAHSQPAYVRGAEAYRFDPWAVYDPSTNQIKMNAETGALAIFEEEHQAASFAGSHIGCSYKQMNLYRHPSASVPEKMTLGKATKSGVSFADRESYCKAWNDCRDAMLATPPQPATPELSDDMDTLRFWAEELISEARAEAEAGGVYEPPLGLAGQKDVLPNPTPRPGGRCMNLRILKKLSKRALPLAEDAGLLSGVECFLAEAADECHTDTGGHDRKHWQRHPARHPAGLRGTIYKLNKAGTYHIALNEPSVVMKGTPMVGWMSGYFEPEWEEITMWDRLSDWLYCQVTDWSAGQPRIVFRPKNPSQLLSKVRELIQEGEQS